MKINRQKEQEEKLRKEKENAQAAKSYCRKCGKEIFPAFHCGCAGGGGPDGGGGGGEEKNDSKSELTSKASSRKSEMSSHPASQKNAGMNLEHDVRRPSLTPKNSMLQTIADLLSRKLITIDDNKGLCTLTIKCDPESLSDLQRKAVKNFVNEIKNELENFKEKNGLKDKDCILKSVTDDKGNISSFSINIPNPKLYNQFIDQLQKNNLLPSQAMGQQDKLSNNEGKKAFNPTPLHTQCKPSGSKD